MANKKRIQTKKTHTEAAKYQAKVKDLIGYSSTDEAAKCESLVGSADEINSEINTPFVAVGLKRQKTKQFVKSHIFEIIVTILVTLFTTLVGWGCKEIIDLKSSTAVCEYRISVIEESLTNLQVDVTTKEMLEQEIKILKLEMSSSMSKDINYLEMRIALLEKEIEYLKQGD